MSKPTLTQLVSLERLRAMTDEPALRRGVAYAREGRVEMIERTDETARAFVRGAERYLVELRVRSERLFGKCTCPVSQGSGFCKHCVALSVALSAELPALGRELAPADADDRFETDTQVERFLQTHNLEHVRTLGAEVVLPYVAERERSSLRYVLGRQGLLPVASVQSIRRFGYALAHAPLLRDQVPVAVFQFLHQEVEEVARARAEVAGRLKPLDDPDGQALQTAALALRARHPETLVPRPTSVLKTDALRFDAEPPRFRWLHDRPYLASLSSNPVRPLVLLQLSDSLANATCDACAGLCEHTLAATDAVLEWLRAPTSLEAMKDLRRPAWERALSAIGRALDAPIPRSMDGYVVWRLHIEPGGLRVESYLHRVTRQGRASTGTRLPLGRISAAQQALLVPEDLPVIQAAVRLNLWADQRLLRALVGHPRVVLASHPSLPVSVELARIGLLADHRGDSVVLVPALDGAPLPPRLLEVSGPDVARYLFEPASRVLTVLDLPAELERTLEVLQAHGNDFPPESHAALVEQLSALSARVPVAMPRTVMGEAVSPRLDWVLTLELQPDGSLRTELRIRPLPGSASFVPGEGSRDVHVRREGKPFHARRDFAVEHTAAREAISNLPFTPLERASVSPTELFTVMLSDAQRALTFLAAMQEQPGPWPALEWEGAALKVTGRAAAPALRVALAQRRDWFGLTGGLSVEGERVSLAVLLDAARRKDRFVRVDASRYVELTDALRRHLERLSDHTHATRHGLEVGPGAADALQALTDEGAGVDADTTWQTLAKRIFLAKELSPRVPGGLQAELRDYQREGYRWMVRLASWGAGAVLADDMGLGKTVQTLALLLERSRRGPQLVVAPTSVGFNWVDEANRFAPGLRLRVFADSVDRGALLQQLGPRDVLVVSYGLLARDIERLSQVKFSTIVFDEAQALKNATTYRAKAARSLQGEFKIALSGTPFENHLGELWSVFRSVFPGLLGSWEGFRERFASPIERGLDPTAAPALSRVLQPFLLRRTKPQVAQELPPRTDLQVPVVLSAAEWQLYEDARLAAISELETSRSKLKEQERRVQVLAALTRLRLLASHPKLYDRQSTTPSSKLKRLMELVEELRDEGHRALVFSQFTSHLALVREALDARGIDYLYLDGQTPRGERRARVQAMQEGRATLFLISLKAGGFGLNLTGADNVIHLDPWWNPAVEDQASDRAHRIGQLKPVTVYRLVSKGTIEEQILALHGEKRRLVEGVLEGKDQAGKLSTQELISLLASPAEAQESAAAARLH